MTIVEEGKQIRTEVVKLRPDKRRRYGDVLRRRIMAWVDRAIAAGMPETDCSKALGIKTWRFRTWRRIAGPVKPVAESLALVPIITPLPMISLVLIAPSGHRVEGLALDQIVTILQELA